MRVPTVVAFPICNVFVPVVTIPFAKARVEVAVRFPPSIVTPFVLSKDNAATILVGFTSNPEVLATDSCAYNKVCVPVPKFQVGETSKLPPGFNDPAAPT